MPALGLTPLGLQRCGNWDPTKDYWPEEGQSLDDWQRAVLARGKGPMCEFEQVMPGEAPEDYDTNPSLEATELNAKGATVAALCCARSNSLSPEWPEETRRVRRTAAPVRSRRVIVLSRRRGALVQSLSRHHAVEDDDLTLVNGDDYPCRSVRRAGSA